MVVVFSGCLYRAFLSKVFLLVVIVCFVLSQNIEAFRVLVYCVPMLACSQHNMNQCLVETIPTAKNNKYS